MRLSAKDQDQDCPKATVLNNTTGIHSCDTPEYPVLVHRNTTTGWISNMTLFKIREEEAYCIEETIYK